MALLEELLPRHSSNPLASEGIERLEALPFENRKILYFRVIEIVPLGFPIVGESHGGADQKTERNQESHSYAPMSWHSARVPCHSDVEQSIG